jgi:Domain of unknown function (DUF1707)
MSTSDLWGQFPHDPRTPVNRDLRAADSDRDLVRQLLTEAFADGRLDRAEFDERSDQVTSARTLGELPPLVSDLVLVRAVPAIPPGVITPAQIEDRAVTQWRSDRREASWAMIAASTICWVIWVATSFGGGFHPTFPWPLFVMLGTGLNLGRIQFQRQERIAEERQRLERKQAKQLRARREDGSS